MIMDKYNCKICNKEVVLENDIDVGFDRRDLEEMCINCYNKGIEAREYKEQMEYEYWKSGGSKY